MKTKTFSLCKDSGIKSDLAIQGYYRENKKLSRIFYEDVKYCFFNEKDFGVILKTNEKIILNKVFSHDTLAIFKKLKVYDLEIVKEKKNPIYYLEVNLSIVTDSRITEEYFEVYIINKLNKSFNIHSYKYDKTKKLYYFEVSNSFNIIKKSKHYKILTFLPENINF